MPPGPATTAAGGFRKRLPTVPATLRHYGHHLVHLLDQNREQVERALERVREGAYGLCEDCGHRIPTERLRYQPSATRCVECQGRWDRVNGRTA